MFSKKERKIFRYNDGTRNRGLDPLEIDIALEAVNIDWEAQITLFKAGDSDATKAIVEAARRVFNVPPLEVADDGTETGLSTVEMLDLLGDYMEWRASIRNFFEPNPTTPPSTEETSPTATASGTGSTSTSAVSLPATA